MAGSITTGLVVGITSGTPAPIDFTSQPRDVTEEFELVAPTAIPFVLRCGGWNGFEVTHQRAHEWVEDDLWKNRLAVSNTTGVAATDSVTITLSANDGFRVSKGAIIQIDSEQMWVSAIASATSLDPVTRGYAGTTAATHATASTIYLLGLSMSEGTDTPYIGNPIKTWFTNYVQFFQRAFQLSEQAAALDSYGQASELNRLRDRYTKDLASLAEVQAIRGVAYDGGTSDAQPPSMGGWTNYITSANGAYNLALSAALAESNVYTMIRSILDNVDEGSIARTLMCRHFIRQKLTGFYENRIQSEVGDHTGGASVSAIETDFGRFEIMHSYNWPDTVLGLVNFDKIKLGHYKGMSPWREKRLAEAGFYQRHARAADLTLEVRNPQTQGQITGISLS